MRVHVLIPSFQPPPPPRHSLLPTKRGAIILAMTTVIAAVALVLILEPWGREHYRTAIFIRDTARYVLYADGVIFAACVV